jgi:hypothetical protein
MSANFDYEGAKRAGYSDEEINEFIGGQGQRQQRPQANGNFDYEGARAAGYSDEEIEEFNRSRRPKPGLAQTAGKMLKGYGENIMGMGKQYALAQLQRGAIPYEIGVAPLASREAQQVPYREEVMGDIENLLAQKQSGDWTPEDEAHLTSLKEQIAQPKKAEPYIQTVDASIPGLLESAGLDTKPKNAAEYAAHWAGWITNPKNITQITREGVDMMSNPQRWMHLLKGAVPTGKEAARSVGAGLFLQAANEGEWGPIGTMMGAVAGDMMGYQAGGFAKGAGKLLRHPIVTPKEWAGRMVATAAKFTKAEKLAAQQQLIKDFREAGIPLDLGTATNNNLFKWMQARLAASGLSGPAFDEFKAASLNQIRDTYNKFKNALGESSHETMHDLGMAGNRALESIRAGEAADIGQIFEDVWKQAGEMRATPHHSWALREEIQKLREKLSPGAVKSEEQSKVLKILDDLDKDLHDVMSDQGVTRNLPKNARIQDLINSKRGIQDKINYEVKGGARQLLKGINKKIDETILRAGDNNPEFQRMYKEANSKFSRHVATFRNKDIAALLKGENAQSAMSKMNTIQGMRRLQRALTKTHEGQKLFNEMKAAKFEQLTMRNMVDGATNQIKLGKFSNILENPKNREMIKEILGPQSFNRFEKLSRSVGDLAASAQKFYNASKSGTTAIDAVAGAQGFKSLIQFFTGNPWPIAKTVGAFTGVRLISKMMTDPVFLKALEDGMLAGKANNIGKMKEYLEYAMRPFRMELELPPQAGAYTPEMQQQARLGMRAEEIGKHRPQGLTSNLEGLEERVTGYNPSYREEALPGYLKEPPRYHSGKESRGRRQLEGFEGLDKDLKKTYLNSWKKHGLPEDLGSKFYDDMFYGELGTVGDFVTTATDRKLLKDVLDIPIHKQFQAGAYGGYSPLRKQIILTPGLSPDSFVKTLHHEAWHALQHYKGKLDFIPGKGHVIKYPKRKYPYAEEGSLEEYYQKPHEIAARKYERRSAKKIYAQEKETLKTQKERRKGIAFTSVPLKR